VSLQIGQKLGSYNAINSSLSPDYSVSADGQRLLMLRLVDQPQAAPLTQINVVVNWFEELKQRVPVR
jgi:hypothetical protein